MNAVLTFLILAFALTAAALWTVNRSGSPGWHRDQFRSADPMSGPLFDDPDADRVQHEADAIRTRFEHRPSWPGSAAAGDRR